MGSRIVVAFGFSVALVAALVACDLPITEEQTDCSVREPKYDDPTWSCVKASEFRGACVPASRFARWGCLELDEDASFCEDGEPFRVTVYLARDGASLDCRDQLIDHGFSRGESPKRPAFRAPYARSVSDISVSNCRVKDVGAYGADLKRFFRGDELDGPLTGHRRLSFRRLRIEDPGQIGIYVGQNSEDFVFEDVAVLRGFIGIYLEAGTVRARITRAEIRDSREREGIAVDSSEHNVIEDSVFSNNGHENDAINFYKNCGEVRGQVCPVRRELTSGHNVVRGNRFEGGTVNVAWRQFKFYGPNRCAGIDVAGYWRDRSPDNLFEKNTFTEGATLDLQDGPVVVRDNRFEASLIQLGKRNPVGDGKLYLDGEITRNVFDDASSISRETSQDVFDGLRVHDNLGI